MIQKYLLTDLGTGEQKYYKSLQQIAEEYQVEYHQIRGVFMNSLEPKRYLHHAVKYLCTIVRIEPNPKLKQHLYA